MAGNIKDVAQLAGVTIGTVSRYINGKSVKEKNRLSIEAAIQKTGFKLNHVARGLKTNVTKTIGVVVPDITSPYSGILVETIDKYLYQQGYNLIICNTWGDKELEMQKIDLLLQRQIDGLILYPSGQDLSPSLQLPLDRVPVVIVDVGMTESQFDQVLVDNTGAIYEAALWLKNHNHRKIGIINGALDYFTSRERFEGYKRFHEDYGLKLDPNLIHNLGYTKKAGYEALKFMLQLESPPTAVIACNYEISIGMVEVINEMKIQVPEKLSLIGFDDFEIFSVLRPRMSMIAQPMAQMGKEAAKLLLRRLNKDCCVFPEILRLKTHLINRETTKDNQV